MMGLPNRALEPISRSWSFCANDIELDPAQDLVQGDDLFEIALMRRSFGSRFANLARGWLKRRSLRDRAMGIGNENDQVS